MILGFTAGEIVALAMFLATIGAIMIGFPVAFTLAGTGLIFAGVGYWLGLFDPALLTALPARYFGIMTNEVLVAVPLFIFMGATLERSKIAEALLESMGAMFGSLRGGLGVSVILVGAMLAASTGIVGATVVTMGLLSLPAMLRTGYDPKLACGVILASGTLGQIIPPSIVLIFVADLLQGANQAAQLSKGNVAPEPVSVGDLFAGAIVPGLVLVGLYLVWVAVMAIVRPASCPALAMAETDRSTRRRRFAVALAPPLLLIVAVLGSILAGIATATEAAAVGAIGAMALAFARRLFDLEILRGVMRTTLEVTSMVFVILLGASVFSLVFRGLGGDVLAEHLLSRTPGGAGGALLAVMALMFVLGFFLDTFEILFIVVPIAAPVLLAMDIDPVWLGVMIGVNLQTSFLTPPFGFSLFYLRGVAPVSVRTADIFSGAVPFVGIQLLTLFLVWQAPPLATWLPDRIYHTPAVEAFGWTPGAGELKNIERIEIPNDENMPPYEFAPDFATLPLADVWPAGGQPETELP